MTFPRFKTASFVKEITVQDPDTGDNVQLEVYKHENGGLFAMDASYLEGDSNDDSNMVINDPFIDHINIEWLVELINKQ